MNKYLQKLNYNILRISKLTLVIDICFCDDNNSEHRSKVS